MEPEFLFLGLSAVFAYLYSRSPPSDTPSGLAYRVIFMALTLFGVLTSIWIFTTTTTTTGLDEAGNAWIAGMIAITLLIIGLMFLFAIYNNLAQAANKKSIEKDSQFVDMEWDSGRSKV